MASGWLQAGFSLSGHKGENVEYLAARRILWFLDPGTKSLES